MEFKGTKGNWLIDSFDDVTTDDQCNDIVCVKPEDWEESMKNWDANKRLISKAPQMLEMLSTILIMHKHGDVLSQHELVKIENLIKEATELK